MKPKMFYMPKEYVALLDFCTRTTNLGEKAESILRSIAHRYACRLNISPRQYEALHNISIECADSPAGYSVLRSAKFDPPIFQMPIFVMDYNDLEFPKQPTQPQITESQLNVSSSDRVSSVLSGDSVCDNSVRDSGSEGNQGSSHPLLEENGN